MVNARDLHGFLKVGRDFSNWIKQRIDEYGFEEGKDYSPILANRSDGMAGKPRIDYHLILDMSKELAMVERNEKGRQARHYFIDCERQLLAAEAGTPCQPTLPERIAALEGRLTAIEAWMVKPSPAPSAPAQPPGPSTTKYPAYWSPFRGHIRLGGAWINRSSAPPSASPVPAVEPIAETLLRDVPPHDKLLVDLLALTRGRLGPRSGARGYTTVSLNTAILLRCFTEVAANAPAGHWLERSIGALAEANGLIYGGVRSAIAYLLH